MGLDEAVGTDREVESGGGGGIAAGRGPSECSRGRCGCAARTTREACPASDTLPNSQFRKQRVGLI
jgi:hypothetical protein